MMVIFTSQSDKRAIKTTRWILDMFANRIGTDTWQTSITEDGLSQVRKLLKDHATKSMAVSCRWIRGRNHSELLWIVGNRHRFNQDGMVAVNYTRKNILHGEWENDWHYLPAVKALAAVAALLHDWGKSTTEFQKKLAGKGGLDPYRHEWISCKLIEALVRISGDAENDEPWLELLQQGKFNQDKILQAVEGWQESVQKLPLLAMMLVFLILSHHRVPSLYERKVCTKYADVSGGDIAAVLGRIKADWGYAKEAGSSKVSFSGGMLEASVVWRKSLQRWIGKLIHEKDNLLELWREDNFKPLFLYARISLMIADYSVSAQQHDPLWQGNQQLYANTDEHGVLKQYLDEHLVRAAQKAVDMAHHLPALLSNLGRVENLRALKKPSPAPYAWQDKAVSEIRKILHEQEANGIAKQGGFVVNMASTGCGKTFANAKIMQALSEDGNSLRYTLGMGLRSLTLQTGDEYRKRIGLKNDNMAVLIGSAAIRKLHETSIPDDGKINKQEDLLDGLLDGDIEISARLLQVLLDGNNSSKCKALLYAPVVVATIDHIMPATECIKGGRQLLPLLRLMSADLVIDEIDDFGVKDLTAIARVVNLAGVFGRKVLISSATITPDLAEGLFSAYYAGYRQYMAFFKRNTAVNCVWTDEFRTVAKGMEKLPDEAAMRQYRDFHDEFAQKRVQNIAKQLVKRRGIIAECAEIRSAEHQEEAFFAKMAEQAFRLHRDNCQQDEKTGRKISIGLIRMANVEPCVQCAKYLWKMELPLNVTIKVMAYHSHQVLLLRQAQERYLDSVLHRVGAWSETISPDDEIIRKHIEASRTENVIFIVVATPVEEVGRDHDFDWAVVEPSSYRSLVQLAGRVMRHRRLACDLAQPNVAIMQYNLKGVQPGGNKNVFCHPGFETGEKYHLRTHDMKCLVDEKALAKSIDAIPRLLPAENLQPHERLIDLEHCVMRDFRELTIGAGSIHGWQSENWWLTGLPQRLNPFRDRLQDDVLYLCYNAAGELEFQQRDARTGEWISKAKSYGISRDENDYSARSWLARDYLALLIQSSGAGRCLPEEFDEILQDKSREYGEIHIAAYGDLRAKYLYSDQLGLYRCDGNDA